MILCFSHAFEHPEFGAGRIIRFLKRLWVATLLWNFEITIGPGTEFFPFNFGSARCALMRGQRVQTWSQNRNRITFDHILAQKRSKTGQIGDFAVFDRFFCQKERLLLVGCWLFFSWSIRSGNTGDELPFWWQLNRSGGRYDVLVLCLIWWQIHSI